MLYRSIMFTILLGAFVVACGFPVTAVSASSIDDLSLQQLKTKMDESKGDQSNRYEREYDNRALSFGSNALKMLGVSSRDMKKLCSKSSPADCKKEYGALLFENGYEQADLDAAVQTAREMPDNTPRSKIKGIPFFREAIKIFKNRFQNI